MFEFQTNTGVHGHIYFPIAEAIGINGLVNATILALFMTSCQPFSCAPTCADQYIIVNKHARSVIGPNCGYRTVHIVLFIISVPQT